MLASLSQRDWRSCYGPLFPDLYRPLLVLHPSANLEVIKFGVAIWHEHQISRKTLENIHDTSTNVTFLIWALGSCWFTRMILPSWYSSTTRSVFQPCTRKTCFNWPRQHQNEGNAQRAPEHKLAARFENCNYRKRACFQEPLMILVMILFILWYSLTVNHSALCTLNRFNVLSHVLWKTSR